MNFFLEVLGGIFATIVGVGVGIPLLVNSFKFWYDMGSNIQKIRKEG